MPYGDRFRRHRKWMYDGVGNKDKLRSYQDLQREGVNNLLRNLLNDPHEFLDHVHLYVKRWSNSFHLTCPAFRYFASIMLQITYGRRVTSLQDELVLAGERSVEGANGLGGPGAQLVDLGFPMRVLLPCTRAEVYNTDTRAFLLRVVQHIPSWFPGAQFKRDALRVRQFVRIWKNLGYDLLAAEMVRNKPFLQVRQANRRHAGDGHCRAMHIRVDLG